MLLQLKGNFIKHKQAKDVCYLVKSINTYNGVIKYKLEIWNMGFKESYYMQDCKAENMNLKDFEFVDYGDYLEGPLRYANWKEIKF